MASMDTDVIEEGRSQSPIHKLYKQREHAKRAEYGRANDNNQGDSLIRVI